MTGAESTPFVVILFNGDQEIVLTEIFPEYGSDAFLALFQLAAGVVSHVVDGHLDGAIVERDLH